MTRSDDAMATLGPDSDVLSMAGRARVRLSELNLTEERLAQEAGVSLKTVSRFLHAQHDPRLTTVQRIAKGLQWTEAELRGLPPISGDELDERLKRIEGNLDELVQARRAGTDPEPETLEELVDRLRLTARVAEELLGRLGRDVGLRALEARQLAGRRLELEERAVEDIPPSGAPSREAHPPRSTAGRSG